MSKVKFDHLLDVWADLKARRLAPVAVGLVVALVAMPVLLLKGEPTAPEAAALPIAAGGAADPAAGAQVELAGEFADRGSDLKSYSPRDPFDGPRPPKLTSGEGDGMASAPADLLAATEKAKDSAADSLGSAVSGGSKGSTGSSDSGGDGDSSGPGGDGGSSGPRGDSAPAPRVKRERHRYAYQLDVRFGRPGRETRREGVARLSFLPDPKVPALLFMGVTEDERRAVFFVHPGLTHQGEGDCRPSSKKCTFLELAIGREHYLAANDREFRIELLKIRRVNLSDRKREKKRAARAGGSRHAADLGDYDWPWLADGVG